MRAMMSSAVRTGCSAEKALNKASMRVRLEDMEAALSQMAEYSIGNGTEPRSAFAAWRTSGHAHAWLRAGGTLTLTRGHHNVVAGQHVHRCLEPVPRGLQAHVACLLALFRR